MKTRQASPRSCLFGPDMPLSFILGFLSSMTPKIVLLSKDFFVQRQPKSFISHRTCWAPIQVVSISLFLLPAVVWRSQVFRHSSSFIEYCEKAGFMLDLVTSRAIYILRPQFIPTPSNGHISRQHIIVDRAVRNSSFHVRVTDFPHREIFRKGSFHVILHFSRNL